MKIFEADDQEKLEFIAIEDDKLFAVGHQIMYFLMNRRLPDAATGNGFTQKFRKRRDRTAQLTDSDHLFYEVQKNVPVKNMKTENHIMLLYLL